MKKEKYIVQAGHTIKHDGKEYKEGVEIMLTEEQAEKLHVDTAEQHQARLVLAGKATLEDTPTPNTKALLALIWPSKHAETVEALMSLSKVKAVATAGEKRLKELSEAGEAAKKATETVTPELLVSRVKIATTVAGLDAIELDAAEKLETAGLDFVNKAISDRKAELEG
jgi:hypothetical protein